MNRCACWLLFGWMLLPPPLVLGQAAPQASFKSGVDAVTVSVSVRDRRGRIVSDLEGSDFAVLDAGAAREIRDFRAGDAPISLALLLDISGSMAVGGNMDRAREATAVATTELREGSDEAAFFTFDSVLREVVGFTTDLGRVRRVSLAGRPWGRTSLYDAIADTARAVAARTNPHRAVLVITDGIDTGSRLTPAEVAARTGAIDVPVYLLTVANPVDHPGGTFEVLAADGRATEAATLADLARGTGGDLRVVSEPAHTRDALRDLVAELRHQYLITFEPGPGAGWHPLEIRTHRKHLVVDARRGFFAGPAQARD